MDQLIGMPLVSIIIPVYNGEKTIQETINSVLAQTFSDFELIVINDGSQDKTLEVVSEIQDPRIKVFSYPNAGLSATRNRGISHSQGQFIAFLDADDLWTADKIEAQLKALQDNPEAGLAYSWSDFVDESSQFLHIGRRLTWDGDVHRKILVINFLEHGSNPLIRREALKVIGNFDESLSAAEDWDMWIRLAAKYSFVVVPVPQILYRVSANSLSTNIDKLEAACLTVIERAFGQVPKELRSLKKRSLSEIYKYLTFKCLEGQPTQQKSLQAARYFWRSVTTDSSIMTQSRVVVIVLFKVLVGVLLPTQLSQSLINSSKKVYRRYKHLLPLT
ncbi:glycosyltransferase [Trichocoleus desertorum AS-A10]|uniref:glycosyltransferase n=1 Tax=Trichocoleus desertorum TaxID=1481672 RepID=UPI003297BD95